MIQRPSYGRNSKPGAFFTCFYRALTALNTNDDKNGFIALT
jgi:hypothetical protein